MPQSSLSTPKRPRSRHHHTRQLIDQSIRSNEPPRAYRAAFWQLVSAIRSQSDLLSPRRGRWASSDFDAIAAACRRLAEYSEHWIRQPEIWQRPFTDQEPSSLHLTWRCLVDHLLHRYETPGFLASTWLSDVIGAWQRLLHFHIGQGKSVRAFEIPSVGRLSKSQARWFMQAPADAQVDEAVRWALARAAGADADLARYWMKHIALLSPEHEWEICWDGVLRFLMRNREISDEERHAIVVFVHRQRYKPASTTIGPWMGPQPCDPSLDIRRWSLRRLRRHMAHWREAFPTRDESSETAWEPSCYQPLSTECDGQRWHLTEIRTARGLRIEGRMMRHCVGSYRRYCEAGSSSIWSLRYELPGNRIRSVMTVEVNPRLHHVWEAQGKGNSRPSEFALSILRMWANREGICLGAYTDSTPNSE